MTDTARLWLVERDYDDKGLVRLVYATPEGDRRLVSERAATMLEGGGVEAARSVATDRLDGVSDEGTRRRYREEVERVSDCHDPDDRI